MHTGECEFGLGLDAARTNDPKSTCMPNGVVEEERFADASVTLQNQHARPPCADFFEQSGDPSLLAGPSYEHATFLSLAGPVSRGTLRVRGRKEPVRSRQRSLAAATNTGRTRLRA